MTEPAVEVKGLSVSFGEHVALEQITFAIPTGAVLVINGPNGSGKTTLLKVLLGLVRPSLGFVRVYGRIPDQVFSNWIGYVPQIKTLDRSFPGLSIELVVSGIRRCWPWRLSRAERDRGLAALQIVGARHLADRAIAQLSGGELQRVYLARAIVRQPRLIMLDEPATGIDILGEESIYRFIDECQREGVVTVVMVTHDLGVAFHHATHVLLLNHRQISFGSPQVALTKDFLQRAYGHGGHPYGTHFEGSEDV